MRLSIFLWTLTVNRLNKKIGSFKFRLNVLYVLLSTNPNDGTTLVSCLQALLV